MTLRSIARVPMNMFNVWGQMPKQHPVMMNYVSIVSFIFFVTIMGKGAEKFSYWNLSQKNYRAVFA